MRTKHQGTGRRAEQRRRTHGERNEVEFGVCEVNDERVGGELDAPRRRDGGGPGLDGGDGDLGARAAEHVGGDDCLHGLGPVRDRHQHLREQQSADQIRRSPDWRAQRRGGGCEAKGGAGR
jgi:hypothetical protein